RLYWPHLEGREASRPPRNAAVQIRVHHQPQDREGARCQNLRQSSDARRRGDRMTSRRDFITLIGGTAVAWPLGARAQQGERVGGIGVLHNFAADDPLVQARHGAFLQGLQQAGWTIGRNVQVETRWAGADADRIRTYAALIIARTGEGRTRAKARG